MCYIPAFCILVGLQPWYVLEWGQSLKYGFLGPNSEDRASIGLGWCLMLSVFNKLPR